MVSRGNRACKDMRVESGLCLICPPAQPRVPITLQGSEASALSTALPRGCQDAGTDIHALGESYGADVAKPGCLFSLSLGFLS